MPGSEIIVCGQRFAIDHPVVTFEDSEGFSAYVPHCTDDISRVFATNPAPGLAQRSSRWRLRQRISPTAGLSELRQVVRQVTVHLDGCRDAAMCFNVLHNERGLSVHFLVDTDGTIYQTLDLLHCAFHAAGVNEVAIGIELQNLGDAARRPNAYAQPRPTVTCTVHGAQFLCYDFTDAQYEAMGRLGRALTRIFDVPLAAPVANGGAVWTRLDEPRAFRGFLGHYHISLTKWDPGPWDFPRLFGSIGWRLSFPLSDLASAGATAAAGAFEREAARYFELSEQDAPAYFPVGPLGDSRLWHGGVHLPATEGDAVHAIARGRIVAARLGPPCPLGSCSFVLLRHQTTLQQQTMTFFSLYFHVGGAAELGAPGSPALPWVERVPEGPGRETLARGEVALLELEVDAGEVIASAAEAGPAGHRQAQLHFAVFSVDELARRVDPEAWEVIESDGRRRLCDDPAILRRIDRPLGRQRPDGRLSRRELRNFFQLSPQREDLRRVVVRHRSEWTPGGWAEELDRAPDFARLAPAQRQRLIAQQIAPTTWWTSAVADHAGLPRDGVIYAYHPIGFVLWLKQLQQRETATRAAGIEGADRWLGQLAPTHLTVDSESANEMTDAEDFYSGEHGKQLELEDIVDGYPD